MKNCVTLVTGAGRGIGRAIAVAMAAAGARVVGTARSQDQLDSLAAEITDAGGQAFTVVDDLADSAAPARIHAATIEHWGAVEVLVNNAGIGSSQNPKPIVDFDDDFWHLTMAVNVTAPYLLTKLVLPAMIEKQWGRIINISSINAKVAGVHTSAYTASKHAITGLTKATAVEVAAQGITVNAVCPGTTESFMNNKRLEYDAQRLGTTIEALEAKASPLERRLAPDEIAALAVFLAQDQACAINGQSINVCGGTVMV